MVNWEMLWWARWMASSRVAPARGNGGPSTTGHVPGDGIARAPSPWRHSGTSRKPGAPRDGGVPGAPRAFREVEAPRGPVVLATLRSAPIAPAAADLAVDLAREIEAPLVVVDVVDAPPGRSRRAHPGSPAHVAAALRAPAERAAAEGTAARVLHVGATRPVDALVALVDETAPAIVVLGPDPDRLSRRGLSRRAYRRAVAALDTRTSCLLWRVTPEPSAASAARRVRLLVHR
jgi:nucleotide-binding universal stress UspA family protein